MAFDEKFLERVQEQLRAAEEMSTDPAEFDDAATEYVYRQGRIAVATADKKGMVWDLHVVGIRPNRISYNRSIPVGGWSLDSSRTWTETGQTLMTQGDQTGFVEAGTVLLPDGGIKGFEIFTPSSILFPERGQISETELIAVGSERALTDLAGFVARNQLATELIKVSQEQ